MGLATGFLLQLPVDLGATAQLERHTRGSYVAEAAIQDTMAWISHELARPNEPCTPSAPNPTRTGTLDGWTWTCLVEPDSGTPPHALTELRIYRLTATASRDGIEQYRVIADVQAGQSFARFSVFINEDGYITYDFLATPDSQVQGPIHKNRPISFLVAPELLSGPEPTSFPFDSNISTTETEHEWHSGGSMRTSLSDEEYDRILSNGAADLQFGVAPRPMPTESTILANAAYGGSVPGSPPPGVTVNAMGGVFIGGDVDDMHLGLNGSGDFVLTIVQGTSTTTVIEDFSNSRRLLTNPSGSTTEIPGLGTGVIFSTGHIHSLRGKNKGPHTIATQFEHDKNLQITGSLTRSDTSPGSIPSVSDDRLGIVADKIIIAPESILPRSVSTPLYIYATVMATDIFEVTDRLTGNPGAMAIYGGLTSDRAWATVDFDNLTNLRTTSGYGGLSGYGSANIYYDKLLADEPPPEYPTTAGTDLMVRSWKEQPL